MRTAALLAATAALLTGACRINPSFNRLPASEQATLQPAVATTATFARSQVALPSTGPALLPDSVRVFKIDAAAVRQFVAASHRPYTDVYVYATFCKPCREELPSLLTYFGHRPDVNLLLVSPESWTWLPAIKTYLAAQRVAFPTYVLDLNRYGDEYSVVRCYQQFVAELYPGHPELRGLPTHLVLNQQAQVVFAGIGNKRLTPATLDSVMRRR